METNRNGVYALPLLRSGTYSVEVSATGFESQTIPVTLDPGELGSQVVALAVPIDKAGGPSCHGTPGTSLGMGISDLLVSALLLGALLVGAFVPAMRRRMSS